MRFGHSQLLDGIIHDGLWDVYNNQHMGMCAEACADKFGFDRAAQVSKIMSCYSNMGGWKDGCMDGWVDAHVCTDGWME